MSGACFPQNQSAYQLDEILVSAGGEQADADIELLVLLLQHGQGFLDVCMHSFLLWEDVIAHGISG